MKRFGVFLFLGAVLFAALAGSSQLVVSQDAPNKKQPVFNSKQLEFYNKQVKPILQSKCLKCHGGEKTRGGLQLTIRESVLKGGDTGPAVDLKSIDESLLLNAVNYVDFEMPPDGKLPKEQIAILTRWVKMGLPVNPNELVASAKKEHAGPPAVNDENRKFWSFQPVTRPQVPKVQNMNWVGNPIDAFVLARLEANGLQPAEIANKTALLRRLYYNLIGVPPSPQDVRKFLANDSPKAYEKIVDRLVDSPQYGEQWGRHWLDLVRYAETNSYERDGIKPNAWRYRDYVIDAFNSDKPYDQFIREQLAGDELDDANRETLIATGYLRLGIWDDEPTDPLQAHYDDLDDILTTTSQVFLGLTTNCARCHDHKLDPITQRDYYAMLSFFNGMNRFGIRGFDSIKNFSLRSIATKQQQSRQAAEIDAHNKLVAMNRKKIEAIEKIVKKDFQSVEFEEFKHEMNKIPIVKKRVPKVISQKQFEQYRQFKKTEKDLNRFRPSAMDMALCVTEIGPQARETNVLVRGNAHAKGDLVQPAFLSILSHPVPEIPAAKTESKTSGRRKILANWISSEKNQLTARVFVNRIWQFHFGRGIVRSPNDFGMAGLAPTHPKLLDWLASELMSGDWKIKRIQKLIVMSNTYRMSSVANSAGLEKDPTNDLFWRFNMRRLTSEEIRDSILAANGSLNLKKMGGPSIYTVIPQEVLQGQSRPGAGWGKSSAEDVVRRSVYVHIKRSLITPMFANFDVADADFTCPVRFSSTQPTQALGMLNSEFINRQAKQFAEFLMSEAPANHQAQVKMALWRTMQREPTVQETERGVKLINSLKQDNQSTDLQALTYFCLVTLNLNEFFYVD